MSTLPNGRIVWHDLMTTDPGKARAFYTQLLGWTTNDVPMPGAGGSYTMVHAQGKDHGGIVPLEAKDNMPSHWIGYLATDDVDAACKRGERLGGKTHVAPMDIPNVGRFAVVSDPAGAFYSPFKGANPPSEWSNALPKHGEFCFEELIVNDPSKVLPYYSEVFGYKVENVDMGPMGTYYLLNVGTRQVGGVMATPPGAPPHAHWLPYIAVDDVDAIAKRAASLGGKIAKSPDDIPNVGRFAVIVDPTGAAFALFKGTPKTN